MIKLWSGIWPNIWNARNDREKVLMGVAAALLALLVLWMFVYTPLSNYPAKQERAYKQAELDLKIMQNGQNDLMGVLQGQSAAVKPVTMLSAEQYQSTITDAAKTKGLIITRRQPKGYAEITLWLDEVDSKALYAWIDGITSSYNVTLTKAQLYRNDNASVRALVTYKLAAGK